MSIPAAILGVILVYLALFFAMSALAARAIGKSVWLFGSAAGADRLAAFGFRAAFALAAAAPLLFAFAPEIWGLDPLHGLNSPPLAFIGLMIAVAGAMIAFAAQVSMGASWRVGVRDDSVGAMVSGGLYDFSRNPTFAGQSLLLAGAATAVPSVAALLAVCLFIWSASTQIKSEERALLQAFGERYADYCRRVPRWLGTPRGLAK